MTEAENTQHQVTAGGAGEAFSQALSMPQRRQRQAGGQIPDAAYSEEASTRGCKDGSWLGNWVPSNPDAGWPAGQTAPCPHLPPLEAWGTPCHYIKVKRLSCS